MRRIAPAALFFTIASTALGQTARSSRSARFMDNCQRRSDDDAQFCEIRELTMPVTRSLTVDGRANGGIAVHGWDRNEIRVTAMVQAHARSQADAEALARDVRVVTGNGELRSDGPSSRGREWWSVSYEVWVPNHTDLDLATTNGGISVDAVDARMNLETVNGGLNLDAVEGDVRGTTTNGGITARLAGERWRGAGLDLRTSNGGVHLYVPDNYSAQLETGTTNGSFNINFPITVQGTLGRHLSTRLGGGGAMIRATTTNGGVSIVRG